MFRYVRLVNFLRLAESFTCECFIWKRVRERSLSARGGDAAPDVDIDVVSLSLKEAAPTGFPRVRNVFFSSFFSTNPSAPHFNLANSDGYGFEEEDRDSMTASTGLRGREKYHKD